MLMAPMGEDLGDLDGMVSDTQVAYLEARARGGLAMVMLGSVAVSFPVGCSNARQTAISDDRHLPGWQEAARRVHAHGAALAVQLTQTGANSLQDTLAGRPMWVASEPGPPGRDDLYGMVTAAEGAKMMEPFVGPDSKLFYKVLDHDDIASVIDDFASAVVRAREAGIDGCELHAGHGYLIDGFLSPAKNHRTDEYGGTARATGRACWSRSWPRCRRRVGDDFARVVPAELHREPARRHHPRRLHRGGAPRGGGRCRRGARVGVPRPRGRHRPDRLVRTTGARTAARQRARGEGRDRRAGDRGGPHRSRRRRRRHRRRHVRLRVDGPHDPRRARAAQPARRRSAGGDPAVRVPLPLHRQHLRARPGALRRERRGGS